MDIRYINNNFQFLYRASSVILNRDKTKILLFNVIGKNIYLLPGGKVHEKETSLEAIKREINEELGYTNLDFTFLALSEEFIKNKTNNHQINIIYRTIIPSPIQKETFNGKEGDWCTFKWVDIKDLNNYNLYPQDIKKILSNLTNLNKVYHFISKPNNLDTTT